MQFSSLTLRQPSDVVSPKPAASSGLTIVNRYAAADHGLECLKLGTGESASVAVQKVQAKEHAAITRKGNAVLADLTAKGLHARLVREFVKENPKATAFEKLKNSLLSRWQCATLANPTMILLATPATLAAGITVSTGATLLVNNYLGVGLAGVAGISGIGFTLASLAKIYTTFGEENGYVKAFSLYQAGLKGLEGSVRLRIQTAKKYGVELPKHLQKES